MSTNVIMHSNVIQIDRKSNKTGKCYSNRISSTERRPQYKSDKISALALFRKTQYPIAFNRKSVTPSSLGIKIQKGAAALFREIQFFTAFNQHGLTFGTE